MHPNMDSRMIAMPFTMAIKNPAMALMMPSQQEAIAETMDPMIIIFKLKIWMGCENVAGVVSEKMDLSRTCLYTARVGSEVMTRCFLNDVTGALAPRSSRMAASPKL